MRKVIKISSSNQDNKQADKWMYYLINRILLEELELPVHLKEKVVHSIQQKQLNTKGDKNQ